ncbi:aromatic/alkene monooxygenase hydroxylase subunit beta [Pseudohaliea rubra]|uniref:Phenol hydroxylase, P1 oxygenase component DmpL n=1 Tax=Pseudohaliea rubra DSM 19751 TaxID=1265313 RepID=A0A095VUY5_9GAMM|nr:aromatic/alkene monooxygenase hydroxylase subunit beta [Pseudohaliea rubra]KGE04878.1 Phenol hydroxylase, P1 oxygenase component DmpL [Pseudohaliea rubra DSM 19751]
MTIEIKTSTIQPIRNTFAHIERRFGDKPASRYQEASYDLAPTTNFHYRPLWDPELRLNDPGRTAISMEDWYAFRDPRQYYYGSYVQARAKLQEITESNYAFFTRRDLAGRLPEGVREKVVRCLLPLRHLEMGANMNNVFGSAYGIGTVLTQAFLYNGMDRLGVAQYLSRIGLILDGNSGDTLKAAKTTWMEDPLWQDLRRYVEDVLAQKDWFEVFVAQDVVLDTLVYDIFYGQFDESMTEAGAGDLAMLIEFMQEWHKETSRWVDSVIKTAVAESDANREQIAAWVGDWKQQALAALGPLAEEAVGPDAINASAEVLNKRLTKAGL